MQRIQQAVSPTMATTRPSVFLTGLLAVVLFTTGSSCTSSSAEPGKNITAADSISRVKRGEYLVSIIGCEDCHSPKKRGPMGPEIIPELRFSGYPSSRPIMKADSNVVKQGWALFNPDLTSAVGPWGMSFSANISSDETGIGGWTEENFIRALRQGKYKGLENSRSLLPPMPWFMYKNMQDEDLKAIFAYLKTTKPVENVVPVPRMPADIK
jgi:hypothetical protein